MRVFQQRAAFVYELHLPVFAYPRCCQSRSQLRCKFSSAFAMGLSGEAATVSNSANPTRILRSHGEPLINTYRQPIEESSKPAQFGLARPARSPKPAASATERPAGQRRRT